jgi:hypothetical protein
MYERILVATDGSPLSKKAVSHAMGLAAATGAALVVFKVVPRYPQAYFEGSIPLNAKEVARIEAQWTEEAQKAVGAIQKAAESKGISAKGLVARSDIVSDAIIAAAKKQKADLVIMASHGRKGIKRLLLGSETQQVLTHCQVPVLVLR